MSSRNDVALDVAHVLDMVKQRSMCAHCHKAIPAGGVAVVAPKLGPVLLFHPACFTCHTCKELLGESELSAVVIIAMTGAVFQLTSPTVYIRTISTVKGNHHHHHHPLYV